jgi:hypothetical protein
MNLGDPSIGKSNYILVFDDVAYCHLSRMSWFIKFKEFFMCKRNPARHDHYKVIISDHRDSIQNKKIWSIK